MKYETRLFSKRQRMLEEIDIIEQKHIKESSSKSTEVMFNLIEVYTGNR